MYIRTLARRRGQRPSSSELLLTRDGTRTGGARLHLLKRRRILQRMWCSFLNRTASSFGLAGRAILVVEAIAKQSSHLFTVEDPKETKTRRVLDHHGELELPCTRTMSHKYRYMQENEELTEQECLRFPTKFRFPASGKLRPSLARHRPRLTLPGSSATCSGLPNSDQGTY